MKTALLKTIMIMVVYAILSVAINFGMYGENWSWSQWLEPLNHIILLDLIPIEGFNMHVYGTNIVYYESEQRETVCKIVNVILIFVAHLLSFLPKRRWLRITLITTTFIIVIGWTLFMLLAMVMGSAG